jgi:hypothetical protein
VFSEASETKYLLKRDISLELLFFSIPRGWEEGEERFRVKVELQCLQMEPANGKDFSSIATLPLA